MKKSLITLITAAIMAASMSLSVWAGEWIQDSNGWKYGEHNGYFMKYAGGWEEIDGKWYLFDHISGYMQKDMVSEGYTLGTDGAWDGNAPIIPEDTNKGKPYVPQYTYSFLSGGPNTEYLNLKRLTMRFKVDGSYLKNQWVRIYSEGKTFGYVYLGNDGSSLNAGESQDGYPIGEFGLYQPEIYHGTYKENGKRTLQVGDNITDNINVLEERVDTNGNTYYLLGSDTTKISYKGSSEIDADSLNIDFSALKYNPAANTINPFSNDGTGIREEFQFDREYDLKIPNTDLRGAALVEYCKQNDIMILVSITNKDNGIGMLFLYCYE